MVDPIETGLANPLELIVATPGTLELQVAWLVTLPKVPSENVAVAVNCAVWFCDNDMLELDVLMVRAVTVLVLTVRLAVAVTLLVDLAVIVVVPSATPVANPALLMVATLVDEEVHITCEVTSPVLLSPKVAVALYCCVPCGFTNAPVGETDSEMIVFLEGKKPEQLLNKRATRRAVALRPTIVMLRLIIDSPWP